MTNEKEIIELLANSNTHQEGFKLLMSRFSEQIYWHIRRLVVRHEDAQDVMQETFINVYKYIGKFKGESSLKTWIYKIATNEAIRHCTKRALSTDSYDQKSRLVELFSSEKRVDFESAEANLQLAILSLSEKQRIVFNLRYYEEMSYEEIAEVTASSIATLKTNYHYATTKIKEYLLTNMEEQI